MKSEEITESVADNSVTSVEVVMTTELKDAEKEVAGSEKDLDVVEEKEEEKGEGEGEGEGKEEEKGESAAVVKMSTIESETAIKSDKLPSVTVAGDVTDTTTVAAVVAPTATAVALVAPAVAPTAVAVTAAAAPKMPVLPVRVKPITPTVLLCSMVSYLQPSSHVTSCHVMSCHGIAWHGIT